MSSISSGTTTTTGYVVSSDTTGALVLKTGSAATTAVTIDASQNVGIGTSSPGNKLTVNGGSTQTVVSFASTSTAVFYSLANSGSQTFIGNDSTSGSFVVQTPGSSYSTKFIITDAGNVGIGTTSPSSLYSGANNLVVGGGTGGTGMTIYSGTSSVGRLFFADGTSGADAYRGWVEYSHIGNDMTFGTNGATKLTLDNSGNLGLGVTPSVYWGGNKGLDVGSPGCGLTSRQNNEINLCQNAAFNVYATTGAAAIFGIGNNGQFAWNQAASGTAGNTITFTTRMLLDTSGNLLLGTTSNNGRLCVQGATANSSANALYVTSSSGSQMFLVRNDGALRSESTYYITTASAGNLNIDTSGYIARSTSSLKYKNSVQDATHGLSKVLALRPVTYKGNNNGDTVFGGLIAEEVHEAGLTEFVQYAEDGSPDALAYGNMVSLAFKAIQEQQLLIQQLQADVAILKGGQQ